MKKRDYIDELFKELAKAYEKGDQGWIKRIEKEISDTGAIQSWANPRGVSKFQKPCTPGSSGVVTKE